MDALRAFTLVADEGSLAAAARRLRRSPAAVTRAIAGLEAELRAPLLHRTTRVVRLTDAGARYLATARQVLAALDDAAQALGEAAAPGALRGRLSLTTPSEFGRLHVRPVVEGFAAAEPGLRLRWVLLDRVVGLVEEGFDAAIRIGALPASRLTAVRLGAVRRILCASPAYLAARGTPEAPAALAAHRIVSFSRTGEEDGWTFPTGTEGHASRVRLAPDVAVSDAAAAVGLAVAGAGITRVLSYQAEEALAAGRLARVLAAHEPAPLPVHIVSAEPRPFPPRLRAFIDYAAPLLRAALARVERTLEAAL